MVSVEHAKGASDSPVLGANVTHMSHSCDRNIPGNLATVFIPQFAPLKGCGKLASQCLPPSGCRPRCFPNRTIHNLAPLFAANHQRTSAHWWPIGAVEGN